MQRRGGQYKKPHDAKRSAVSLPPTARGRIIQFLHQCPAEDGGQIQGLDSDDCIRAGGIGTGTMQKVTPHKEPFLTDSSKDIGHQQHDVDVCVVGGGITGVVAALSAARHGAKVVSGARYVVFQMAEVAIPSGLFRAILERIRRLKPPSVVFR